MKVKLTHRGGYRVFRSRVEICECKTEREAIEAARIEKLELKINNAKEALE